MKKHTLLLILAAWLTGIVSIIYELVWVRYLGLLLGNSVYAVGIVTACYMVGLALGDFVIGKWTTKNLQVVKAVTFAGLAVYGFLSPFVYKGLVEVNVLVSGFLIQSTSAMFAGRVIIAFVALLIPTFFMGGVLPVLIESGETPGGVIYGANTLGAVTGAAVTGFVLIKYLGVGASAIFGGALALLALALATKRTSKLVECKTQKKSMLLYSAKTRRTMIAAYMISGFTGMAFQMYQTRVLTLFFMDSVYDFAIILAVYLGGLCIGNLCSSYWADRTPAPVCLFAFSQILLGISAVFSLFVINKLPYWTEGLGVQGNLYQRFGENYWIASVAMKVGYTCLIVLIPAILWGMAYPLVHRVCVNGREQTGREAGRILGWNTIGSAMGSFAASFLLMSLMGIQKALLFNGCINALTGLVLLLLSAELPLKRIRTAAVSTVIVMILTIICIPPWNKFEMSTSFLKSGQNIEEHIEIKFYKEDANGITSVVDFLPYGQRYLTTNRLYCQNTSDMTGPEDHRRLGYLPLMIHQNPKTVLVEGLGAGVTLRGVAEYGNLDIDCVEISGAVKEAAAYFKEENGNVLESPQVNLTIDDARNYLMTTKKMYDVIIADIFFPMSSGSSSMFSREYYESCKKRLNPEGIMAQWIPLHQFSEEELEITMKTFSQVFPHASLWFGMIGPSVPVVGLLGSSETMELSYEKLEEMYMGSSNMDLKETALDDPYMFLSHFVCEITGDSFSENIRINTDERPILEFLNPTEHSSYRQRGKKNLENLVKMKTTSGPYVDFQDQEQLEILEEYDEEIKKFILGL